MAVYPAATQENLLMRHILQNLSVPALTEAIEANLFELFQHFRQWPQAETHFDADILWSITDIPFPLFNSVLRAQLAANHVDTAIETAIARCKSRKVSMLWWTGPQTRPPDLGKHLERHGFIQEDSMPGMAADLSGLRVNLPTPSGFHIQRVADDATLKLWSQICGTGFGMPDFVAEAFYDLISHVGLETMQAYLGWLDETPVATSLQVFAAGVAGIYNVATVPEARRQGIGAEMTAYALREARLLGYQVGILGASEMGVEVYRSLGFREYCRIDQYVWQPLSANIEEAA
jgi:GNAT superfamily N-acetyltransferase